MALGLALWISGCASVRPAGSDVPRLAEAGTAEMPLDLEPVVASATLRLTGAERRIAAAVDERRDEAIAFLERTVNVNSGTMNHDGVREVGRLFEAELAALGLETRWIDFPPEVNRAGHLFAEIDGRAGKRVLLIGHLDTVYEKDSPFQAFERLDEDTARGPGVADMKGGDVVILFALKALADAGLLGGTRVIVALLGDEEQTGDPLDVTRAELFDAARRSDAALGFEGGVGGINSATVARRGFTGWTLDVAAKQGHSSLIFSDEYGAGAIFEASRILDRFYQELRGEEYLTFGAGLILGGTSVTYDAEHDRGEAAGKTNVIPQAVTVAGDLRALTSEQVERTKRRMRQIVSESLPQTSANIRFRDSYPPMAPTAGNYALLEQLDAVSKDLGFGPIEPVDPGRRGAADVSFAAQHADALGGLGVAGSGDHSPSETVDLASLSVMTKRAALLVYRLSRQGPEGR